MRDPYELLGLGRSASEAEIKRAYRKLAKINHPDRHGGDAKAESKAQGKLAEINAAYEILGDKGKRAQFDRGEIDADGKPRHQGFEGFRGAPAGQGGQAGFENVDPRAFADLFSSLGRGGGSRTFRFSTGSGGGQAEAGPGGDEDLIRSMFGGLGGAPHAGMGGGRTRPAQRTPGADIRAEIAVTLEDIAAGQKPTVALPSGKTVALTLPAGVADGQAIRLPGQGRASLSGGPPGDVLVTVRFVPHPHFKVEGSDLRLDLPVSLDEAVLGAKIAVPTLAGKVHVTLPPHASSGRVLRLKGRGLPKAGGHGDILVAPRIVLPDTADAELDTLMLRWRETERHKPRGSGFS